MPLSGDSYICDLLRKFEMGPDSRVRYRIIFKKRLNYQVKEAPTDSVELDLVYAEVNFSFQIFPQKTLINKFFIIKKINR